MSLTYCKNNAVSVAQSLRERRKAFLKKWPKGRPGPGKKLKEERAKYWEDKRACCFPEDQK